jgi:P-type Ca2+ transporter type 2C
MCSSSCCSSPRRSRPLLWVYERETALPYEAIAIFAVVVLNATLGYVQEARAEAAVAALRAMSAADAAVVRDGERQRVPTASSRPRRHHPGRRRRHHSRRRPADSVSALQTAEAALTGESLPVVEGSRTDHGRGAVGDRQNMIFSGTAATYGRGVAVVTATGMQTEMGQIAGC